MCLRLTFLGDVAVNTANRGKSLEKAVKLLFERYESRGIHCQQNHPEQLHDGTLVKRHGFDFQIFYNGKFIAFDAKECARSSWPLDKAKMHQIKALFDVYNNGGEAFFLVYFTKLRKLIKLPISTVMKALEVGEKKLSPDSGILTTIDILGINDEVRNH